MKTWQWGISSAIVLVGFAAAGPRSLPAPDPAAVKGISPVAAMALANAWGRAGVDVQSFVTPQAVQFKFKDGRSASISLPKDKMVVAIAPYINTTHPCETHYMSSCMAELKNTPVKVTARTSDGKTLVNTTITTLENGFLELWLPRDQSYSLMLEAKGKMVRGLITTFASSNTCVTTLQLQ